MSGKAIGMASDFYRLRLVQIDEQDLPDLEWRDDILYRTLPAGVGDERECFLVEAVDVDDDERVVKLATFEDREEAYEFLSAAQEDLDTLTRSEFELRHKSE